MSRKHSHAYAAFQLGKGLVGFLAGLVLATMIIIAVLLMLNSNSKRGWVNNQPPPTDKTTETLHPNGTTSISASAAWTDENTITDKDRQQASTVEPIASSQTTGTEPVSTSATTPPVETSAPAAVEPIEQPPVETNPPTDVKQPIDDPIANEPTGEAEVDTPAVTPPVRPPVTTPPRVNDKTGVPDRVRPNYNETGKKPSSSSSGGQTTTKPRPSTGNTGTLKQDDLNIAGVDTPRKPPVKTTPPTQPTVKPTEPKTPTKPVETKTTEPKKVDTVKPKPPVVKETPKTTTPTKPVDVKPTPQQILDSGNIEKARELARKQAANKPAATAAAAPAKRSSGAVVIQAGSYGSRNAAESQRARLALLGVQARIVEANVNGKSIYRVQTNRLEGSQVNNTRSVLQRNGVSTLERSAD